MPVRSGRIYGQWSMKRSVSTSAKSTGKRGKFFFSVQACQEKLISGKMRQIFQGGYKISHNFACNFSQESNVSLKTIHKFHSKEFPKMCQFLFSTFDLTVLWAKFSKKDHILWCCRQEVKCICFPGFQDVNQIYHNIVSIFVCKQNLKKKHQQVFSKRQHFLENEFAIFCRFRFRFIQVHMQP